MNKSLVLLSGGLDSLVSIALAKNEYDIELALTFNYGQKSAQGEILAAQKICEHYGIEHKIIELDWLKNITKTALVSDENIPTKNLGKQSAKAVWVPNRNGLFLNIAASFADSQGFEFIIIGANKEEAQTFPDNSAEFCKIAQNLFEYSTLQKPKVLAPLIDLEKKDIIKKAIEINAPLELVRSCYVNNDKNCGMCESCQRLKSALQENNAKKFENLLF